MVKQSDLVNPNSLEEYGSHANTDDEYEEYSEEEILSEEEEPNKAGSSGDESTQKVSGEEEPDGKDSCTEESDKEDSDEEPEEALEEEIEDDALVEEIFEEEIQEESEEELNGKEPMRSSMDRVCLVDGSDQVPGLHEVEKASDSVADDKGFCTEDSDEELEEAFEEDIEEDASIDEIIEVEISEELEEKPNVHEVLRSSVDQLPLVNDGDDVPSLLEGKKAADAVVDVPRVATKRRRSGWDIKAEDVALLNDRGDQGKSRKTRWSSETKTETSLLGNDDAEPNKPRKTRWSSDQSNSKLQLFNQTLEKFLKVKTSSPATIDGDQLVKLLTQEDDSISKNVRGYAKNKKPIHPPEHNLLFKKKIYFPSKEYPNYNFVGLLLGPKGNTLKKMEEDTGATIRLRGGSLSRKDEESFLDKKHVLIEADSQFYLDDAVRMVEKLLVPVDDQHNYHKLAQLRELAEIRGTLRDGQTDPARNRDPCDICGKLDHPTSGCPLAATESQINSNFRTGSGSLFSSNCLSYPGFHAVPPPSLNAILPSYPGFVGIPPPLNANLRSYPESTAVSSPSSKANLSYAGFVAVPSSSSNASLPSFPEFAGATLLPSNANLPSYPGFPVVSSSSNLNLQSYPGLAALPNSSLNANLPSNPGFAATTLSSYPGPAFLPLSPNVNPPANSEFTAIPPPSSNSDLPNYPGVAAAVPLPSSIANLPPYPGFAAISRDMPKSNKWPGPPGSMLPESDLSFFERHYNSLLKSGSSPLQPPTSLSKNADILGEKNLGIAVTGTPSSGTSFPRSDYDSLKYANSITSQYSTYLSSTGEASISSYQLPSVHEAANELASFPGLKSTDTSHPFDQLVSSSSLSSQQSYFTRNFSGNQMNPTWRNYNHPTSN